MGQSSDELRQEIDQHRADASSKIDQLTSQVTGSADDLREQAEDAVTQAKDTVQSTVEDSVDQVKQMFQDFDVERHVQERPLVSVGAAMLGGVLLGILLGGGDGQSHAHPSGGSASHEGGGQRGGAGLGGMMRKVVHESGLEDQLSSAGAALMGSVTDQVKRTIDKNLPGFADNMTTAQRTDGSVKEKSQRVQSTSSTSR